jgi:hypothetical protein
MRPKLPRPACITCGKPCKVRKRKFCSVSCRAAWQIGRSKGILQKPDSQNIWTHYNRMHAICPAGPCTACGLEKNSRIHHVDHNPLNNAPDNLVRMCHACHITHHKHYNKIISGLEERIRQLEAMLIEETV